MNKRFLLTILLIIGCLTVAAKTRKAVYIIIDGVPADQIERLKPEAIFDIASRGAYSRAYTGGEIRGYSQTATISAIGYTNLLTSTVQQTQCWREHQPETQLQLLDFVSYREGTAKRV